MNLVNKNAIQHLKVMFNKLSTMGTMRALDVGCGGCEVSRDLLRWKFDAIDFLDRSSNAIIKATKLKHLYNIEGDTYRTTM